MKEIKPLTSLRGIFALWVLLFHLNLWSPYGVRRIPVIDHGYLAVDFFFVLSGFILAGKHGTTFTHAYSLRLYGVFVWKRLVRLFPLHLVVLIFCTIGLLATDTPLYWWRYIVGEVALIHRWNVGFASATAMNPPDWSISTEWAANLLFPAFVWAALRGGTLRTALLCGGVALTLIYVASHRDWTLDATLAHSWLPLLRCFAEFAAGMLVFRWRDNLTLFSSDLAVVIVIVATGYIAWIGADLLAVPLEMALTAGLANNNGYLSKFLSMRLLYLIGKISFSIYLVQIPVLLTIRSIAIMSSGFEGSIYFIGTVAAVLGISWLTYYGIERPAQKPRGAGH